jgi:hypothetical protein
MSQKTLSVQSQKNEWEKKEKLAALAEEQYIKAGNLLRATQCRLVRERYGLLKGQSPRE